MKKYIIFIVIMLYASNVFAWGAGPTSVPGIGGGGGAGCTPCSDLSTSEFYWTGDYDADCGGSPSATEQRTACITGDTTLEGTLSGGTISNDVSESTSTEHNGTYIFDYVAADDYLTFAVTGKDIFDSAQGYISYYVYCEDTYTASNTHIEIYYDGNNQMVVRTAVGNVLTAIHVNAGTSVSVSTSGSMNVDAWNLVEVKWDASIGAGSSELSINLNSAGWDGDADADDLAAMASEPTSVKFGNLNGNSSTDDFFGDDLRMDTSYP